MNVKYGQKMKLTNGKILKEKIMENKTKKENILIPKTVLYSVIIMIFTTVLGSYINTEKKFISIEKEIEILRIHTLKEVELLKIKVNKDFEILDRIESKLDEINQKQVDMDKKLILKQDKKFLK